jgi:hypothetical protein
MDDKGGYRLVPEKYFWGLFPLSERVCEQQRLK